MEATRQRVLDAAAELATGPIAGPLVEMYPVVEKLGYHLLLGAFTPGRGQDRRR